VAAAVGSPFDDAEVDSDLAFGGRLANAVEVATFNGDSLADIVCVEVFLQAGFEFRTIGAFDPEWIAGQQGLAEDDKIAVNGSGLVNPIDDLCDCRVALQPDWRNLRQSDFYCATCQSKFFRKVTPKVEGSAGYEFI